MHLFRQLDDSHFLKTWGEVFDCQMAGYFPGYGRHAHTKAKLATAYPVAWQGVKMPKLNNIDSRERICLGEVM